MARNRHDWREMNEGNFWKDLDRIKGNWQGQMKDLRASSGGKSFPPLGLKRQMELQLWVQSRNHDLC